MSKSPLAPKFPCAVPSCPAMVQTAGHRCAVHRTWTDGPHTHPCAKCRQTIVFGDLWRLLQNDPARPVHSQCVGGIRRETVKHVKGWDANLGQLGVNE